MNPPIPGAPPATSPATLPATGDHWRRFRRLMLLMTVAAIATAAVAIWQMRVSGAPLRLHFLIALGGGIVITLLLAGALMGLAFVSSRSGHDESINLHEE